MVLIDNVQYFLKHEAAQSGRDERRVHLSLNNTVDFTLPALLRTASVKMLLLWFRNSQWCQSKDEIISKYISKKLF